MGIMRRPGVTMASLISRLINWELVFFSIAVTHSFCHFVQIPKTGGNSIQGKYHQKVWVSVKPFIQHVAHGGSYGNGDGEHDPHAGICCQVLFVLVFFTHFPSAAVFFLCLNHFHCFAFHSRILIRVSPIKNLRLLRYP